jgi:tetratricopeptide (TPR) repeat protein
MRQLTPPDNHHLNAATGWLELGNHAEAKAELAKISAPSREHPDVLELEWRICAAEKNWANALETACKLVQVDPDNAAGWIHQSYSLHELKRTKEAFDLLLPVVEKFADISTIPYNLACYACQLDDVDAARRWLAKAVRIRGKDDIKKVALADPDLQRMWEEIEQL